MSTAASLSNRCSQMLRGGCCYWLGAPQAERDGGNGRQTETERQRQRGQENSNRRSSRMIHELDYSTANEENTVGFYLIGRFSASSEDVREDMPSSQAFSLSCNRRYPSSTNMTSSGNVYDHWPKHRTKGRMTGWLQMDRPTDWLTGR